MKAWRMKAGKKGGKLYETTQFLGRMGRLMKQLIHIIGLAPSELSPQALRKNLERERERTRKAFQYFRESHGFKAKGGKAKSVIKLLKEAGLTKEEFLKGVELLKKEAK